MDEPKVHKRSDMPEKPLTIGLIGHVSHGKTSLAAAITKFYGDPDDAERMRPDTRRGIEIKG